MLDLTRDDHAYFFGFLQTDGHLHQAKIGKKGQVSINLARRDEHILWEFKALVLPYRSSVFRRTWKTNFAPDGCEGSSWVASRYELRRSLQDVGLPAGRKSAIIKPPTVDFNERGYLRGVIDGDGSIGLQRTGLPFINFWSMSKNMVQYFCDTVLRVAGTEINPCFNARGAGMYLANVSGWAAKSLAEYLYKPGTLALDRKRALADQIINWKPKRGTRPERHVLWTAEEDAIVAAHPVHVASGMLPDRAVSAIRTRRGTLRDAGVELPDGRLTRIGFWTAEEDAIAMLPITAKEVAERTGRKVHAVESHRYHLRRRAAARRG